MPYLLEKSRFGINFFHKKKHYIVVVCVPSFHLSARSSSFFLAFFLHFYGKPFIDHPITERAVRANEWPVQSKKIQNKSNRVRTIDAFSSVHIQVFVLVFVLILVPVLLTVAWLVILSCYIPSCTITLLKIGQIRDFNSCVTYRRTDGRTDRPTDGRTHPLIEMRRRI